MEYEKAYVFEPQDNRPAKRRRVEPQGLQASWRVRRQVYQTAWQEQQCRIKPKLEIMNSMTVSAVSVFLDDAIGDLILHPTGIPTGIILTGPGGARDGDMYKELSHPTHNLGHRRVHSSLSSNTGANLKALLKVLIQNATSRQTDDDDDDQLDGNQPRKRKGAKLLSYDLQLLADHVEEHRLEQVVVSFEDTEAFDSDLLSELLELLFLWSDRIPFAYLFNIATSVDFLQQRLSKEAVKRLRGRLFDVAPAGEAIQKVFEAVISQEKPVISDDTPLWIGPGLGSMALERQSDYIQSTESFINAVKYAYMSHFYANALSIFLKSDLSFEDVPSDHFDALRNLDSFRSWARDRLDDEEPDRVRDVLESDEKLFNLVKMELSSGSTRMRDIVRAINLIWLLQFYLPNTTVSNKSSLYVQATSGKLHGSAMIRSLLLMIRKQPSDVAVKLLSIISFCSPNNIGKDLSTSCEPLLDELRAMMKEPKAINRPLRSADDVKQSTLRTTIVAQKVELSKQKSALSKEDTAYTALLKRFTDILENAFDTRLVSPFDLPFHEIFLYDLKSPHREVFTPRPRHAIERALAAPHDYLACQCCAPATGEDDEATLSATQPATAVLYQLYLESGSLINASDLWQAFQAVMGDGAGEEETMALFQRALADLRMLGMVKSTRKRVDHIAKVAWRGL